MVCCGESLNTSCFHSRPDNIKDGENQRGVPTLSTLTCFSILFRHVSAQKLNALRAEADASIDRAELAEAKNKKLEMELLARDQEITSLTHKLNVMEADLEKAESKLAEAKTAREDGDTAKTNAESLIRRVQIVEEELDSAEKNLKETVEKYVFF